MSAIPDLIIKSAVERSLILMANNKSFLSSMFERESVFEPEIVEDFHRFLYESITVKDGKTFVPVTLNFPPSTIKAVPHVAVLHRSSVESSALDSLGDMRGVFESYTPSSDTALGVAETDENGIATGRNIIATTDIIGHTDDTYIDILCFSRNSLQTSMLASALRAFLFRSKHALDVGYGIKSSTFELGPVTFHEEDLPSQVWLQVLTLKCIVEHEYNPYSLRHDEDEEFWNSVVPVPGSISMKSLTLTNFAPSSDNCEPLAIHKV